jgi:hypothetical protein
MEWLELLLAKLPLIAGKVLQGLRAFTRLGQQLDQSVMCFVLSRCQIQPAARQGNRGREVARCNALRDEVAARLSMKRGQTVAAAVHPELEGLAGRRKSAQKIAVIQLEDSGPVALLSSSRGLVGIQCYPIGNAQTVGMRFNAVIAQLSTQLVNGLVQGAASSRVRAISPDKVVGRLSGHFPLHGEIDK